jgi:hypothetical protein
VIDKEHTMNPNESGPSSFLRRNARPLALAVGLTLAAGTAGVVVAQADSRSKRPGMPADSEVETKAGVRIVRASLAADGGLLDVRYIVLNAPRAQQWMADTSKPPALLDQRNGVTIDRVAPMRDAHQQRPGQTYYLVYQNTRNTIHRGDRIDITVAGVTLHDVPVE